MHAEDHRPDPQYPQVSADGAVQCAHDAGELQPGGSQPAASAACCELRAVAGLDGLIDRSIVENEKQREQGYKSYLAHTDTAKKSSTGYVERRDTRIVARLIANWNFRSMKVPNRILICSGHTH